MLPLNPVLVTLQQLQDPKAWRYERILEEDLGLQGIVYEDISYELVGHFLFCQFFSIYCFMIKRTQEMFEQLTLHVEVDDEVRKCGIRNTI